MKYSVKRKRRTPEVFGAPHGRPSKKGKIIPPHIPGGVTQKGKKVAEGSSAWGLDQAEKSLLNPLEKGTGGMFCLARHNPRRGKKEGSYTSAEKSLRGKSENGLFWPRLLLARPEWEVRNKPGVKRNVSGGRTGTETPHRRTVSAELCPGHKKKERGGDRRNLFEKKSGRKKQRGEEKCPRAASGATRKNPVPPRPPPQGQGDRRVATPIKRSKESCLVW